MTLERAIQTIHLYHQFGGSEGFTDFVNVPDIIAEVLVCERNAR